MYLQLIVINGIIFLKERSDIMPKFLTVDKAIEEVEFLSHYLEMVKSYNPDTIEKRIIFEYAHFGNGKKVYELLNKVGLVNSYEYVMDVIKSKPIDELHKIVRQHYMQRTKGARNPKQYGSKAIW